MKPANDNSPWPRRIDDVAKVVLIAAVGGAGLVGMAVSAWRHVFG